MRKEQSATDMSRKGFFIDASHSQMVPLLASSSNHSHPVTIEHCRKSCIHTRTGRDDRPREEEEKEVEYLSGDDGAKEQDPVTVQLWR